MLAYPSSTSRMGVFDLPISMPTLSIFKVQVGDVFRCPQGLSRCPQLGFKDAHKSSFEPSKTPTTPTNSHSKSFLMPAVHTRMPAGGHKGFLQVVLRRCPQQAISYAHNSFYHACNFPHLSCPHDILEMPEIFSLSTILSCPQPSLSSIFLSYCHVTISLSSLHQHLCLSRIIFK